MTTTTCKRIEIFEEFSLYYYLNNNDIIDHNKYIEMFKEFTYNYNIIDSTVVVDHTKHWKNRFTQDVIPLVNKGYRLVAYDHGELESFYCTNCYHHGDGWECSNCWNFDPTSEDMRHMSYEEFRQESGRFHPYTYETYCNIYRYNRYRSKFDEKVLGYIIESKVYKKYAKGDPNGAIEQYDRVQHAKTYLIRQLVRHINGSSVFWTYNGDEAESQQELDSDTDLDSNFDSDSDFYDVNYDSDYDSE